MGIKERILSMMRLSKGDGGGSAVVRKRDRKLVVELMRQTESLTRSDLSHWRMAHQMAIDVENPTRVQLLRIYRDVELDGHLSGAVEQIRGKVKARSFKLVNAKWLTFGSTPVTGVSPWCSVANPILIPTAFGASVMWRSRHGSMSVPSMAVWCGLQASIGVRASSGARANTPPTCLRWAAPTTSGST